MQVHKHTQHHMKEAIGTTLGKDLKRVDGFNAKIALVLTQTVGTMWCFWAFACLALVSLPAAISTGNTIIIVAWVAQTFLQLVLLPALMVGQNLQNVAADARASKTFNDVEEILERLDIRTQGGIKEIYDLVAETNDEVHGLLHPVHPPSGYKSKSH